MDKVKLKYIALIALPIVVLGLAYYFLVDQESDNSTVSNQKQTDDLSALLDEDTTIRKSKSEIYKELSYKDKRKMELSGQKVSDDDFFGGSLEPRKSRDEELERMRDSIEALAIQQELLSEPKPQDSYQNSYNRNNAKKSSNRVGGGGNSKKESKSARSGFTVENFEREEKKEAKPEVKTENQEDGRRRRNNGFYNASTSRGGSSNNSDFIPAKIHESIKIRNNTVVPIRLTEEATIAGNTFPRNTIVYGLAQIGNGRVNIKITSVKSGGRVYPVTLEIYDVGDAMAGLAIKGSSTQEKAEGVKDQASSGVNVSVPVVGSINVGSISRNKVEEIPVYAEYKVLVKVKS